MGRLLIILGVVLIVAGFGGMFAGKFLSSNLNNLDTGSLIATPSTTDLCKAGESLITSKGSSEYTQGQGYASAVQYFCQAADGVRRDVTDRFVNDLREQASGFMSNVGQQLGKSLLWSGMISLGFVLMILGLIITRLRSGSRAVRYNGGSPQIYVNGQPVGNASQIYVNGQPFTPDMGGRPQSIAPSGGNLADKLRQLENARNAGLITSDEYDRARQAILKEM